jgi:intracellular septation protein A
MEINSLLMGLIPLVVFVVIDSVAGVKAGIISAIVFALLEAGYTYYTMRRFDEITMISLLLVSVFGFLSYRYDNPLFFKLQPVILGVLLGIAFLVMQYLDKPVMVIMAEKYRELLPLQMRTNLQNPMVLRMLKKASLYLGFGFFLHAAGVAYAAFYLSSWWWLAVRGIGLYVVMGLCMVATVIL